jgi:MinD-like ATPase involved in chromosome partitioning or flagellar assembly
MACAARTRSLCNRLNNVPAESPEIAFISLLRDEGEARELALRLESVSRNSSVNRSLFLVPDVRGLDFFAAKGSQPALDRWWGRTVPRSAMPVYLLRHEEGLASWLGGLDGVFMVAATRAAAATYPASAVVDAEPETAPSALAKAAILRFAAPADTSSAERSVVFDRRDARTDSPTPSDVASVWAGRPELPSLLRVDGDGQQTQASPAAPPPDPFDLLAAESAGRAGQSSSLNSILAQGSPRLTTSALSRVRSRLRLPLQLTRRTRSGVTDSALAGLLVQRAPTVVVIGSRKGGVGKTSHAAGMAITAGAILDSVGHSAAIVDANIANPDAWGQLNLPASAATVHDVAAALAGGHEPPRPIHSATPALACYPERRDGVEYSRTDIRRLAAHLRARYAFVVVDMSNRLPDPTAGPEATVASYWLEEADALVLPAATSLQDFNGVLDYLDVPNLPPTVVPYIVSSARRNRRHPMTRSYLESIGARVDSLVEIPDEADNVRLAVMQGAPVQDVSPRMGLAYRQLTEAVARLPMRIRR